MLMGGLRTVVGVSGEVDEDRKKKSFCKGCRCAYPDSVWSPGRFRSVDAYLITFSPLSCSLRRNHGYRCPAQVSSNTSGYNNEQQG